MQPYELVVSSDRLGHIANEILAAEAIGLDIETLGFSPFAGEIRLVQLNTGKGIYVIDLFQTKTLGPVVDALRQGKAVCIIQNAKYESKWFKYKHDLELWPIFDTYRASALIYNGKLGLKHDLYAIWDRELGVQPEAVDLGASDWSGVLSKQQLDYAAEDVIHLLRLREVLKKRLQDEGLFKVALLEFGAALPEAEAELNGFYLNPADWTALAESNAIKAKELHAELMQVLPHPHGQMALPGFDSGFNLDSPVQLSASLAKLGLVVPSTKEMELAMHAADYPVVSKLVKYRKVAKNCSSFGTEYLRHIDPRTGRVHVSYFPMLVSGRYSCLAPWTPVKTARGTIPLIEVVPGDEVWTHKERWRKVTAFLDQGVKPVYRVKLSNGDEITCTADHRFLCSDQVWRTVEEIENGRVKTVDRDDSEPRASAGVVSEEPGVFSDSRDSRYTGDIVTQRDLRDSRAHVRRRARVSGSSASFDPEIRVEESYAREARCGASQLDRGARRQQRLFNLSVERGTPFCTSRGADARVGSEGVTKLYCSSAHRWQCQKQFDRQLGSSDPRGVRNYGCKTCSPTVLVGNREKIEDGRIKIVDGCCSESRAGVGVVSRTRTVTSEGHRGAVEHICTQRSVCHSGWNDRGGTRFAGEAAICGAQGRSEESYVWENGGIASQLEGGLRRRLRISNLPVEWQAALRTQSGDDGGFGVDGAAEVRCGSSYRWGSEEQLAIQSSDSFQLRAQEYSLYGGSGSPRIAVEFVKYVGLRQVYDLSVAEDKSFQLGKGAYAHNCQGPNLQQVPRDKYFRRCFQAPDGWVLVVADYGNIEMRIAAELSMDPTLLRVFNQEDGDAHRTTAAILTGKERNLIAKDERQKAKPVNFGFLYMMGPEKMILYAQAQYGVALSLRESQLFKKKWLEAYAGINRWQQKIIAHRQGILRTASGRLRYLDPDAFSEHVNTPVQGLGADGLKVALRNVYFRLKKYSGDALLVHHVHDEIILQVRNRPELISLVQNDLVEGMKEGMMQFLSKVKVEVEAASGPNWADAKS